MCVYNENLQTDRKLVYPPSRLWFQFNSTCFITYPFHPPTHPSFPPAICSFLRHFKEVADISILPVNTSACTSLNGDQYWFTSFYFWEEIYIKWNASILSVHLLHVTKCIYLCNPNPYQDMERYQHAKKFPLPTQSLPYSIPALLNPFLLNAPSDSIPDLTSSPTPTPEVPLT